MSNREKDKGVVIFGADQEYIERMKRATEPGPPVGGASMPPMPRFDQPTEPQYTPAKRDRTGLITSEEKEQLINSGQYIPGTGSDYRANQPGLNHKQAKAEILQGTMQNPPRPEGEGLRPETVKQIEAVVKASASDDKKADALKADADKIDDDFDYDDFGNRLHTLLQNKPRREAIEARCGAIHIEDMITLQEIQQVVPIIPNKYFPTFRTTQGHEDLYIKKKMSGERGSEAYIQDRFSLLGLALGLYALNGHPFPSHMDKDGEIDDLAFEKKFKTVLRFPIDMLADLAVNYGWFGIRVKKLMIIDEIKGF